MDLESDMTKVPARTLEILASCHALVFVDNKLVLFIRPVLGNAIFITHANPVNVRAAFLYINIY